jgi:hypothetical protein
MQERIDESIDIALVQRGCSFWTNASR